MAALLLILALVGGMTVLVGLTTALVLQARQLSSIESRIAALETRPVPAPAPSDSPESDFPRCRITLQDPGPDPDRIGVLIHEHLGISLPSAQALVAMGQTDVPVPDLGPQEAYRFRTALSDAGAIVSLFVKREDEDEPHPNRPTKSDDSTP